MNTQDLRKTGFYRSVLGIFFLIALALILGAGGSHTAAQIVDEPPTEVVGVDSITWKTGSAYSGASLRLDGPEGVELQFTFSIDDTPGFVVHDGDGPLYPDGGYDFELRYLPQISAAAAAALENAGPEEREDVVAVLLKSGDLVPGEVISGHFYVYEGFILVDTTPEPINEITMGDNNLNAPVTINDQMILDDLIVDGSACIGFDCINEENFGFDTLRLKENNLRLHFQDTSASSTFPTNDWRIVINDSANGGNNYFAIQDAQTGSMPFYIEAGAPGNALYVENYGRIGMGTSNPTKDVHIAVGDTPTVRLDQDGSLGWAPQIWDIGGNEANFFVRDVSNGYTFPFRIKPNAPSDSISISSQGNVGVGIYNPLERLHLYETDTTTTIAIQNSNGTWRIANSPDGATLSFNNNTVFELDRGGNLELSGALTEASDVNVKENFKAVNQADVLARIAGLPLTTWNYIADGASVRHMGPMAQDFYAAFGLGEDETHIAPLDVNGVTLVGMQALIEVTESQGARIAELEEDNADLEARLAILEAQMQAWLDAQE